jgi:hypothetical protein
MSVQTSFVHWVQQCVGLIARHGHAGDAFNARMLLEAFIRRLACHISDQWPPYSLDCFLATSTVSYSLAIKLMLGYWSPSHRQVAQSAQQMCAFVHMGSKEPLQGKPCLQKLPVWCNVVLLCHIYCLCAKIMPIRPVVSVDLYMQLLSPFQWPSYNVLWGLFTDYLYTIHGCFVCSCSILFTCLPAHYWSC